LLQAAQTYGFHVSRETAIGHPLETAALNANIAFSKTVMNWIQQRNPLAVLAICLPLFVLLANCLAWTLAALGRDDDLMPYAYKMVWIKV
jgi:hypothetical protein